MDNFFDILIKTLDGIAANDYLAALGCLAGGWILRQFLMMVLKRILHLSSKTETVIDDILIDAVTKPLSWLCFTLGVWAAVAVLPLPEELAGFEKFLLAAIKAIIVWLVIWFAVRLVDRSARHMESRAQDAKSPALDFVPLFRKTAKILLVVLGILVIVQNLGYSVASLLAGLGLGGLAIGLAAKDTIANFFGSVVIFVDRPFTRGDWIKIGDHEGVVEEIGVRVTRVRTFADHLITIPNAQLTTTPITNFTAMRKRRIKFDLAVNFKTPPEKLELAITRVKALIVDDSRLQNDDFTVYVKELGAYSIVIGVVCFALTTDYPIFAQAQQDLLLNINRLFREMGIEFAFPTQTIHHAALPQDTEEKTGRI